MNDSLTLFPPTRRLVIKAMQELRTLEPEKNEWVSPQQVDAHISGPMGMSVKSCGTIMADMTQPEQSRNNKSSGVPPIQRVLDRAPEGKLYRLPSHLVVGLQSRRRREYLLDNLTRENLLSGIALYESGHSHSFKDSTKFDLLHEGKAYPPKAVMGLAGVSAFGEALEPDDFTGGADSKCFRVYTQLGFKVVPKPSQFPPTASPETLEAQIREARKAPFLPKPEGQQKPNKRETTTTVYERSALVVAFVLERANGVCECCGHKAPFIDRHGEPFLEVHHVIALGEEGPDTVENAVAICPNCHRECHLGQGREVITGRLQSYLQGLYPSVLEQAV